MPVPATTGSFKTNILDMAIGDYIAFKYTASSEAAGTFSDFGAALAAAQANEIPATGAAAPNGYAYALKVAPGLLICDRVLQHSISHDVLNTAKLIQGKDLSEVQLVPIMTSDTSPSGVVSASSVYDARFRAYVAVDGNESTEFCTANNSGNSWWMYEFSQDKVVNFFKYTTINSLYSIPNHIKITGITAAGVETTLYENLATGSPQRFSCYFQNGISYKKYRINFYEATNYVQCNILLGFQVNVRSLTGGVAFMGADGLPKLTDAGLGAWPPVNEWDKYIVGSNLGGKITAGDDNVWHWSGRLSITQETPINGMICAAGSGSNVYRIDRSYSTSFDLKTPYFNPSSAAYPAHGFRPVFEFLETGAKASNLWY